MKIYFAGSITGGRDDMSWYLQIIDHLKNHGVVLTEHIGDHSLSSLGENKSAEEVFHRDINWVKESDVVIAEVTNHSLGVGYELGRAESWNKHILCLYRIKDGGKRVSPMITGNPKIPKVIYSNIDEAKKAIDEFFEKLKY